jgi:hypothetical protein
LGAALIFGSGPLSVCPRSPPSIHSTFRNLPRSFGADFVPDQALPRPQGATIEPPGSWARLRLSFDLLTGRPERLITIDKGPRTTRVSVAAPRWLWYAALAGLATSHPLIGQAARWALEFLK